MSQDKNPYEPALVVGLLLLVALWLAGALAVDSWVKKKMAPPVMPRCDDEPAPVMPHVEMKYRPDLLPAGKSLYQVPFADGTAVGVREGVDEAGEPCWVPALPPLESSGHIWRNSPGQYLFRVLK